MRRYPADIPAYDQMMNPVLEALRALGGSGRIAEIDEKVFEIMGLPDNVLSIPHTDGADGQSEIGYRLAWTRTYLGKYGALSNSSRGVWALAPDFKQATVDPAEVVRFVHSAKKAGASPAQSTDAESAQEVEEDGPGENGDWRSRLREVLIAMDPSAFERLVKRFLREAGFTAVEVTGKSGDGGIDGKGIMSVGGVLSFHVMFQCKKYQGSVASNQIRDFRGAMQGRTDKGLFVTTGTFTRDAVREATRDGAPPIDLIDGEQLCEKLKELNLGVTTRTVEVVDVDAEWFGSI